jgi:hypothetical protein
MNKHKFTNPTAQNLGEALGIPLSRQNEIGKHLDEMVARFSGAPTLVYLADIVCIMEYFCNTQEEFLYAFTNHITWHAKRGSLAAAKTNRTMVDQMRDLTPDQRMEVFGEFCKHCGWDDPKCQCWNDE